jgi:hypothetical protein
METRSGLCRCMQGEGAMRNQNNKKTTRKLSLSKETVRQLTHLQLGVVVGGVPTNGNCTGDGGNGEPTAGCTGGCWTV